MHYLIGLACVGLGFVFLVLNCNGKGYVVATAIISTVLISFGVLKLMGG